MLTTGGINLWGSGGGSGGSGASPDAGFFAGVEMTSSGAGYGGSDLTVSWDSLISAAPYGDTTEMSAQLLTGTRTNDTLRVNADTPGKTHFRVHGYIATDALTPDYFDYQIRVAWLSGVGFVPMAAAKCRNVGSVANPVNSMAALQTPWLALGQVASGNVDIIAVIKSADTSFSMLAGSRLTVEMI